MIEIVKDCKRVEEREETKESEGVEDSKIDGNKEKTINVKVLKQYFTSYRVSSKPP